MEEATDNWVMERVQAGETAQLSILFERYHLPLFRYLFHLTESRSFSEELVQEVFLRVLKYAKSFDGTQSFASWIYQTARNAAFDAKRKWRAEVSGGIPPEIRSAELLAEDRFSHEQNVAFLQEALRRLSPDKREVLVMSRFQGLQYEEIARILHCEVGAVKLRVYRAMKQLRETFTEVLGEKAL